MSTLTTVSGTNYALRTSAPPVKLAVNQNYGRIRVLYDYYSLATGDNFGTSGLIRMFIIPAGSLLHDAIFMTSDLGTTGVVDIGHAASADGVETADADSIFAAADCKTGTPVAIHMTGLTAKWKGSFASPVEAQIDFTEASDGSGARTISLTAFVAVD